MTPKTKRRTACSHLRVHKKVREKEETLLPEPGALMAMERKRQGNSARCEDWGHHSTPGRRTSSGLCVGGSLNKE